MDTINIILIITCYIIPMIIGLIFNIRTFTLSDIPVVFFPLVNIMSYIYVFDMITNHIESKGKCTHGHTWYKFEDHQPTYRLSRGGISMRRCTICEKFECSSWSAY